MSQAATGDNALIEKVVAAESGGRSASLSGYTGKLLVAIAIAWSLFQLWISSPLPFVTNIGIFNDTIQRSIHLAFAVFIVFLAYPLSGRSRQDQVPLYDWVLNFVATFCVLYVALFYRELVTRPGLPTALDVAVAVIGTVLVLEATRRALGKPMMIMAILALAYMFAGPYMPELIAHKGASLARAASHQWLTTEGVFGVALGVSTAFVFLYVLFGAMLDQAGAGNYLTRVAFALLGHMRGGPAKAAVLSSGLNGLISGSSVANVLTGGNVTIMLMKRVGYSPVKAGAIEVSSSSNGQIMPPVMGAAAFLICEYVNVPYSEVVRAAFLPAILAYVSLLYIVHIEAVKAGMKGLPRRVTPLQTRLVNWTLAIASIVIVVQAGLWLTDWLPRWFGESATWIAALLLVGIYLGLVFLSARYPEADTEVDVETLTTLPETRPTVLGGVFYILPVWVLVWCLMVFEQSAQLAAFYACAFMALLLLTQRPLVAWARGRPIAGTLRRGARDLTRSLEVGARNMVPIAVATACAGIIVGTVSLTGIGQVLAEIVETLSFGSLMGVLLLTAAFSLVLGMGLPTTANYIVVSTLLAPVIVTLAATHGLEVPLIAVHLFVFYFGIMADATPPVALAAYAAAGLSGADPLETGVQGFIYEMRTAILPFIFVFNTELLLIGVDSPWHFVWVVVTAVIACFAFASATQRFWLTHNRWWETVALLVAAFSLFRPDLYRDWFYPLYDLKPAGEISAVTAGLKEGEVMRLRMEIIEDKHRVERTYIFNLPKGTAADKLAAVGLVTQPEDGRLRVVDIPVNSSAEKLRLDIADKNYVLGIEKRNPVPWKGWFTLPAFILLVAVFLTQRRRCVAH